MLNWDNTRRLIDEGIAWETVENMEEFFHYQGLAEDEFTFDDLLVIALDIQEGRGLA